MVVFTVIKQSYIDIAGIDIVGPLYVRNYCQFDPIEVICDK